MTDDSQFDIGKSRRSFLKEGAIATGGLALGLSAGGAAAQNDTDGGEIGQNETGGQAGGNEGTLYVSAYYPNAKFAIVSDALDWSPNSDAVSQDAQAHMIRYLNTGEVVPMFVSGDANIPQYDQQSGFVPREGGTTGGQMGNDTGMNETGNDTGGLFGGNDTNETGNATNETNDTGGGLFGGGNDTNETGNDTMGGASQGTQTRPAVYEFSGNASLEGQNQQFVSVSFSELNQTDADAILDTEDWWQDAGQQDTGTTDGGLFGNDTGTNETGTNETGNATNETDGGLFGNDTNETGNATNETNDTGGGLFGGGNDTNGTGNDTNETNDSGGGLFGGGGNDTNDTGNDSGNDSGGGIF